MANTIILKTNSVANTNPSSGDLVAGELAFNKDDKRLFTSTDGADIVEIKQGGMCDTVYNTGYTTFDYTWSANSRADDYSTYTSTYVYKGVLDGTNGVWFLTNAENQLIAREMSTGTVKGVQWTTAAGLNSPLILDHINGYAYIGANESSGGGGSWNIKIKEIKLSNLNVTNIFSYNTGNIGTAELWHRAYVDYYVDGGELYFCYMSYMSDSSSHATADATIWYRRKISDNTTQIWSESGSKNAIQDYTQAPVSAPAGSFRTFLDTTAHIKEWTYSFGYRSPFVSGGHQAVKYYDPSNQKFYDMDSGGTLRSCTSDGSNVFTTVYNGSDVSGTTLLTNKNGWQPISNENGGIYGNPYTRCIKKSNTIPNWVGNDSRYIQIRPDVHPYEIWYMSDIVDGKVTIKKYTITES